MCKLIKRNKKTARRIVKKFKELKDAKEYMKKNGGELEVSWFGDYIVRH